MKVREVAEQTALRKSPSSGKYTNAGQEETDEIDRAGEWSQIYSPLAAGRGEGRRGGRDGSELSPHL